MFISIITGFAGYFINDLSDMEEDRKAGKKNMVARLPHWLKVAFLPIILILIFICYLIISAVISPLAAVIYCFIFGMNTLLFTLYSIPPVRLKETPFIAPVLDALYSGTLFYLLSYSMAIYGNLLPSHPIKEIPEILSTSGCVLLLLFIWGFLKGLRNFLSHLSDDRQHDERSGLKTLATTYGSKKIQFIANLLFPLEILCLTLLFLKQKELAMLPVFLCILFISLWIKNILNNASQKYIHLNDLHEVWLPMLVLLQFVYRYNSYFPLLLIHFLLFPYHLKKIYHVIDFIYFHTFFRLIGPIRKNKTTKEN